MNAGLSDAAAPPKPAAVDEVVVTAQKRAERLQDVPVSVSALSGAQLAKQHVASLEDITKQVSAIDVPTILVAGELDRVDPVATLQSEVLQRIPRAVLHVLPGTGHLSMLESPELLVPIISDFADSLPAT